MRKLTLIVSAPAAMFSVLLSACAASPPSSSAFDPTAYLDMKAREMGYHIETHNGAKAYCHNAAPTASRISRQDCLDSTAMTQMIENAEQSQDELARRQQRNFSIATPTH